MNRQNNHLRHLKPRQLRLALLLQALQSRQSNKPAFSLIELTLVLALISVLLAITIPRLPFFSRQQLRNELNQLSTSISYLQQRAIASGQPTGLIIDASLHSYQLITPPMPATLCALSKGIEFGFLPKAKGPPGKPTSLITSPYNFENNGNTLSFLPDGSVQAGSIYLVDKARTCMGGLTISVGLISSVRKYLYTGLWKPLA